MKKIISNKVRCKKCNTVIESTNRHDFVWCPCVNIAVDGGHDYLRRVGDIYDGYEELSEEEEE